MAWVVYKQFLDRHLVVQYRGPLCLGKGTESQPGQVLVTTSAVATLLGCLMVGALAPCHSRVCSET